MVSINTEIISLPNTNESIKVRLIDSEKEFFLPLIHTNSDYQWQLKALNSRIQHPEWYENDEDVPATIEKIKRWLVEHNPQ